MATRPLLKALTDGGIGPRRRLADAIRQGRVTVNGAVIEDFTHTIDTATDRVLINGRPVALGPPETVCLMLNKPAGVISTTSDERGRRTITDLIPEKYRRLRLYPAGRLDEDSTGLLLLTNDGDLTYRLTHPRFEHEKEYLVRITGSLTAGDMRKLEGGIRLEDGMTHPAMIKRVSSPPFNYSITIHEGRKRQVRRMFERLKHPVLALKRVRIGGLYLGDLKEGKTRKLSAGEIKRLLEDYLSTSPPVVGV